MTLNTAKFQSADSLASVSSGAFCSGLGFFPFNSAFVFLLKVRLELSGPRVPFPELLRNRVDGLIPCLCSHPPSMRLDFIDLAISTNGSIFQLLVSRCGF